MSIFIDTGVFYAHHDADAERHTAACELIDAVLDGTYGHPYTSDYVLDEAVTLTRARTNSVDDADAIANRIRGSDPYPSIVKLIYITPELVAAALETFRRYDDHNLSFTDALIVAICKKRDIDAVASFDSDFDGLIKRVES